MIVADAHVHYFSSGFFRLLGREDAPALLEWDPPGKDLAGRWAAELDRHRVAKAVLIASLPGDELSVAEAVRQFPDRFWGFFMVNPAAAGSAQRVAGALEAGMRGLCFFPAMHRYSMQDDRALALLELAAAHPGAAAFVHCGVLSVGVRKKLGLPSPFDMRYSNPLDLHAAALRFEKLPFIVPHFGAGMFREALMLADLCPNVYLDTSSSNGWLRYEGMTLAQAFARAIAVAGSQRLLFGTDSSYFPRGWNRAIFDEQLSALRAMGADEAIVAQIAGENLIRLLDGE